VRLIGEGARVAVLANAIDGAPADVRQQGAGAEVGALASLGLRSVELDLRRFFGAEPRDVRNELEQFAGLWVRGGNVFVLRCALGASGADAAICDLLAADRLVYAGYSAGPCVLAPSLDGLQEVDDVAGPQEVYGVPALLDGLAVLDRPVVPHVDSPSHPESAALDRLSRRYAEARIAHVRLRDGQALVVEGDQSMVVGRPASVTELLYV